MTPEYIRKHSPQASLPQSSAFHPTDSLIFSLAILLSLPHILQFKTQPNQSTMQPTATILISTLFFPYLSSALLPPYPISNATNNGTNSLIKPPAHYYLRTRVIGSGNADKDGLYVAGYHIGVFPIPQSSLHPLPKLPHPCAPHQLCYSMILDVKRKKGTKTNDIENKLEYEDEQCSLTVKYPLQEPVSTTSPWKAKTSLLLAF